jgi:hypothetical protein
MANPTTNYGWPMPTATDLVTDLPADFAAFGQPVDTSLKALNPETTLGDISYRSSTANTNTRLGIGSTSQVLTVAGGVPTWATPAASASGLTLVTSTTISAATNISVNSCFTSTYANYLVMVDIPTVTGTSGYITLRLRAAGTDTTTGYSIQKMSAFSSTVVGERLTSSWQTVYADTTNQGAQAFYTLLRPNMAEKTRLNATGGYGAAAETYFFYGEQSASTQFDGFTLTGTATLTGTIRVYGYQNS